MFGGVEGGWRQHIFTMSMHGFFKRILSICNEAVLRILSMRIKGSCAYKEWRHKGMLLLLSICMEPILRLLSARMKTFCTYLVCKMFFDPSKYIELILECAWSLHHVFTQYTQSDPTSKQKIKMKICLAQNPFLNKTKPFRVKFLNSKTITISCQWTFKHKFLKILRNNKSRTETM